MGIGIIGLGAIAAVHAQAIRNNPDSILVAGLATSQEKAEKFCKIHGGHPYSQIDTFLSCKGLDAVAIATPSGLHLECALAAMKAGKHVIIEKPLEITVERCDQLIAAARTYGVKLAVIFQSRFYEASQLIKNAVDAGRFGRIVLADAQIKWFRSQQYYDSGAWRGTWALDGGGVLMNQAIHAIDLLQWLAGDVEEVSAFSGVLAHSHIEVEDTSAAVLKFRSGALGTIQGTTGAYPGFLKRIEICGTKGSAILEEESLKAWSFEEELPEDMDIRERFLHATGTGGGAADPKTINTMGHDRDFADFVASIRENREPAVTGIEARKSVEIIQAIYRASETGRNVKLPLV